VLQQFQELKLVAGDIKDKKEQLILFIHAANLTSGLKCTGILEDDPESDYVLPPNWNQHQEGVYSLKYSNPKNKEAIYFKFIAEEWLVDVNAVRSTKTGRIYSSSFKEIKELNESSLEKILTTYKKEILDPINDKEPKTEEKTESNDNRRDPLRVYPDENPFWRSRNVPAPRGNPFGDYGISDLNPVPLDPFGEIPTGQGNLLGPNNPIFSQGPQPGFGGGMGIIQPGPGQPGVRFDPYGPNGVDPFEGERPRLPGNQNPNPFGGGPGPNPFGGGGRFGGGGFGGGGGRGFWG